MAERGADEPLESRRIRSRTTGALGPDTLRGEPGADPEQVRPGDGGAGRRDPVPDPSGEIGQPDERALGQDA